MQNSTPPLHNQDFFNRLWQHFVVEANPQAVLTNGTCVYRSADNNNGCAIGCMLPDDLALKADAQIKGSSISEVLVSVPEVKDWFINVDYSLLRNAQLNHDDEGFANMAIRTERLRKFAATFKLTVPQ